MILLLDNYDSFTYNLKDYLLQNGQEVLVLRNDAMTVEEMMGYEPDGIVISPGPGRPEQAGHCMALIRAAAGNLPILGICLGMQAMALHYGGSLKRAAYPMHGKVSQIQLAQHFMFNNLPSSIEVCRYHSLVVEQNEHSTFEVLARTSLGEIMAIEKEDEQCIGLQFHPEAILTQFGLEMISNWLKHITLQSKVKA